MRRILGPRNLLIGVLTVAVVSRAAVLFVKSETLLEDRDAYLAIAQSLADGNGYNHPTTNQPTAYRPPMYPVVLATLFRLGGGNTAIAILHLVLGVATVLLTWSIGRRFGSDSIGLLAAGLVAVDPLLVGYTTIAMTETLFTFLVTMLIAVSIGCLNVGSAAVQNKSETDQSIAAANQLVSFNPKQQIIIGFVFGLCALCRPTIWAFGVLMSVLWIVMRSRLLWWNGPQVSSRRPPWLLIAAIVLTVSPWVVRNVVVMGRPLLTTTHGGYTLLLGNNPVFYQEVAARPWGAVWDDAPPQSSQSAWYSKLKAQLARQTDDWTNEFECDRWMYRRAIRNISNERGMFVRACWLRIRRFWNVAPSGPIAESLPAPVKWGIVAYYSLISLGLLIGMYGILRNRLAGWLPLVVLAISFSMVHALYWSNMRMRAPVVPAIALICSLGLMGARGKRYQCQPPSNA